VRKMRKALIGEVRDRVRDLANTEAFQRSCRELRKVEMRFAHMKRILKLDRSRLRGLTGVKMNAHRFGQNLRRLAKLHCRPPPNTSSSPA
jgi:Transposase DDE domain